MTHIPTTSNMRPLSANGAPASRSTSFDNDQTPMQRQPPQMSYFIADERTMEAGLPPRSPNRSSKQRGTMKQEETSKQEGTLKHSSHDNYGVESLETTLSTSNQDSDDSEHMIRKARRKWKRSLQPTKKSEEDLASAASPILGSEVISRDTSPFLTRRPSQISLSRPFTPVSFSPSVVSSPDSRRSSDAGSYMDDIASQAIVSSGEEDRGAVSDLMMDSGSAPQLVMPSIKMPSRRPFTARGKNMGRLKVLIAGDSGMFAWLGCFETPQLIQYIGVGKTSLIKAIVQICEDIVHVDPLAPTPVSIPEPKRRSSKSSKRGSVNMQTTTQITEVYASTRAYPPWWSDLEESRVLRRRKSMGDSVLERNLCFVDTPGYGKQTSVSVCVWKLSSPLLTLSSSWRALLQLWNMSNLNSRRLQLSRILASQKRLIC